MHIGLCEVLPKMLLVLPRFVLELGMEQKFVSICGLDSFSYGVDFFQKVNEFFQKVNAVFQKVGAPYTR